jgi:hypothetical protein
MVYYAGLIALTTMADSNVEASARHDQQQVAAVCPVANKSRQDVLLHALD